MQRSIAPRHDKLYMPGGQPLWYAADDMMKNALMLGAALTMSVAACCPSSLKPDVQRPGARVVLGSQPPAAGVFRPADWPALGMPVPRTAQPGECRHDREELESWLGKRAESCDRVRGQELPPASGDADQPVSVPVAPSCYCLGKAMLVVEYEMIQTNCTRVVGLSIMARE